MKARIRPEYPETAVLLFMNNEKAAHIASALGRLNIRTLTPPESEYGETVGCLAQISGFEKKNISFPENAESDELIIFAGITPKRLDKILDTLRSENLTVRFKVMLTEYNRSMTVPELTKHLFAEEAEIRRMNTEK